MLQKKGAQWTLAKSLLNRGMTAAAVVEFLIASSEESVNRRTEYENSFYKTVARSDPKTTSVRMAFIVTPGLSV